MDDHYIQAVRKGSKGLKGKPYALFYFHSYGGGGWVIDARKSIFRRVGTQVGELVESRGYPSPRVLEECRGWARCWLRLSCGGCAGFAPRR